MSLFIGVFGGLVACFYGFGVLVIGFQKGCLIGAVRGFKIEVSKLGVLRVYFTKLWSKYYCE